MQRAQPPRCCSQRTSLLVDLVELCGRHLALTLVDGVLQTAASRVEHLAKGGQQTTTAR